MTVETILSNPVATTVLSAVLIGLVILLRDVGPRRALALEPVRRLAAQALDSAARRRGRPLVRDKTGDSGEHLATVKAGELELAKALWAEGYRWNPIATKKYRTRDGGKQWSILSVAWREGVAADDQHHAYVFRNSEGELVIRGHAEPSVTDPDGHHGGDGLIPGDPNGRFSDVVGRLSTHR